MIICRDALFVHVPKMAGTSVRQFLLAHLPTPLWHVKEHVDNVAPREGVTHLRGNKHGDLVAAQPLVAALTGRDIPELPMVLACIRNPYEREVAWFAYWNRNRAAAARRLDALWEDFEEFTRRPSTLDRKLTNFYELDGEPPPTQLLLRTESLDTDLPAAMKRLGIESTTPVPRVNVGAHGPWRDC